MSTPPTTLTDDQRTALKMARAARRSTRLAGPKRRASTIPARKGAGSYRRRTKHGHPLD